MIKLINIETKEETESYIIPKDFTGIVESSFGTKQWYQEGHLHRLDGPAYIGANGTKRWYQNDKFHRIDGPAYIGGIKEHWINGKQYYEQDFNKAIKSLFPNKTKEEMKHLNATMNPIIVQQLVDNELKCLN
jgi:hypothetical protein